MSVVGFEIILTFFVGETVFKARKFYVSIDGMIRTAVESFDMALGISFCSYFVFSIMYPSEAPFVLEFIQRYTRMKPETNFVTFCLGKYKKSASMNISLKSLKCLTPVFNFQMHFRN